MTFCISRRNSGVVIDPLEKRNLSELSIPSQPDVGVKSGTLSPGLQMSAMRKEAALPNTTMSSREFAPNLLAPCTDAQAASPAANKPGTIASGSSFVGLTTSPL
jgi:hypothetical protein